MNSGSPSRQDAPAHVASVTPLPRRKGQSSPLEFTAALGDWSTGTGPLYAQLGAAVERAIRRGDLAPGVRLPPERVAASMLGLSRGTVIAAYRGLRDGGWVESRRGSGTWVPDGVARGLRDHDDAGAAFRRFTAGLLTERPHVIDLGLSLVPSAEDLPAGLLDLRHEDMAAVSAQHGCWPGGLPDLRAELAERATSLGERCTPESVVVTGGGQQALATAAGVILRRGDTVVVESPTYPGAIDAFTRLGARIATIPFVENLHGADDVRRVLDETRASALYLIPTCHNPTGQVMSEARRRRIARVLDEREVYLLEDETLADVTFDGSRPRSIASLTRSPYTITIGSLSKSVWGGLRIGWLRAPVDVAERAVRAKAAQDLGLSVAGQVLGMRALAALPQVTALRRPKLEARAALLRSRLQELLPSWGVTTPLGGLSLWVDVTVDGDRFAQYALRRGVSVSPGTNHCPDGTGTRHIRVAYSRDTATLLEAAERLRAAWDDYANQRQGPRATRVRVAAWS